MIKPIKLIYFVRNFLDVHCPGSGGYFRPCRPQIGVLVRLWEVKNVVLEGTNRQDHSLVSANGKCCLQEVSVSSGPTVFGFVYNVSHVGQSFVQSFQASNF